MKAKIMNTVIAQNMNRPKPDRFKRFSKDEAIKLALQEKFDKDARALDR